MPNKTTPEQTEYIEIPVSGDKEVVVVTVPENVEVQILHTPEEEPAAAPTPLDNLLTVGLVGVLALVAVIAVIRKALSGKKTAVAPVEVLEDPVDSAAPAPVAPGTAGELKLHNVEPKNAAMIMAIVADKLGKPLNELRFISIKEVE